MPGDNTTQLNATQLIEILFEAVEPHEIICLAQQATAQDGSTYFRHHAYTPQLARRIGRTQGAWYVCSSTVHPAEPGQKLKRRKQDCIAAHVVMLDDIGTKIDKEEIDAKLKAAGLEWIALETSQGNFQYIFLIEPTEDLEHYEACIRGLVKAGFGDEGAQGANRVFRIPGSINLKEGRDRFQTRVTRLTREVYELDDIVQALDVQPFEKAPSARSDSRYEGIIPADYVDETVVWLNQAGMLGHDSGEFIEARCPNHNEHTDGSTVAYYSPLGHGDNPMRRVFYCHHAHCQHLRTRTYLDWIAQEGGPRVAVTGVREFAQQAVYELTDVIDRDERIALLRDATGSLDRRLLPDVRWTEKGVASSQVLTKTNVEWVMREMGVRCRFNLMNRLPEFELEDGRLAVLAGQFPAASLVTDELVRLGIRTDALTIMEELCLENPYHPMGEWLAGLEWDGVSRLDELAATVDVADEYVSFWPVALRKALLQTCQAVCGWADPQQMEHVLVLSGPQGVFKTTWLQNLAPRPEWFLAGAQMDMRSMASSRDTVDMVTSRPMVELGELETTFRKSDAGALKAFLSNSTDTYRSAYARHTRSHPRVSTYYGSVNQTVFLIDETGSRRFWVVVVKACRSRHLVDMEQVWAEVYTRWQRGEDWHLDDSEAQMRADLNAAHEQTHPTLDACHTYLATHDGNEVPMNARTFCEKIGVPANNENSRIVKNFLIETFGPMLKRYRQNYRNVWLVPTGPRKGNLTAV